MDPSTLAVLTIICQIGVSVFIGFITSKVLLFAALIVFMLLLKRKPNDGFEIVAIWMPMFLTPLWLIMVAVNSYIAWRIIF